MARLDRLAPTKEIAQIGAVIGREFGHELLVAVAKLPEEAGLGLYEQGDYSAHADYFGGHDAKVCASGEAALVLWHLGQPERALRFCLDALEWGELLDHAGSLLHALDIAVTFRRYRREPDAARTLAERMIELGRERGLADHHAKGRLYLGWSIAVGGQPDHGIAMIEEAFKIQRGSGTPEDFQIYSDMLAEVLVAAGRVGLALDEVERAIAESEARAWPIWLPELHRRRGEVLLAMSVPCADEAEVCFGEALTLARNLRSRSLELRAARNLARLWAEQSRRSEARDLLAPIYRCFTEGFDTPDLIETRALLDALA
jgi:predicted ATPase